MDRQSWFSAGRGFWYDFNVASLTQQLLRMTHLRSRWASCDSGRKRTSVSSRSLSCRPFWRGSLDKFYRWWLGGSRHLGCVQLPQYGHGDQSRLSSLVGSESTAGTIKKGMKWNTTYKHCALLCSIYSEAKGDNWTSSCSSEYLWSLFLPELHLSLYQPLSPARLLLQSFLQFLPPSSFLLQSLPAHLHLTLLHR